MKKAETLITEISRAENELYENYSAEEIRIAIEKCEEEGKIPISCTDLISVIYEGVTNESTFELAKALNRLDRK